MAKILIVGAGFAGSTVARTVANAGIPVDLFEKRSHIGGNAYDHADSAGIQVHKYGPHIFHTNDKGVLEFLSAFTNWRFYEHRVLVQNAGKLIPFPINRLTLESVYERSFTESEASELYEKERINIPNVKTSEDVVLNSVGHKLCDMFFRNYTRKQWGLDLSQLSAGVASRIPTRNNDDDRYFTDKYQFMPSKGFTHLFDNMLDHSDINIHLNSDYFDTMKNDSYIHTFYTGPIDIYFNYRYGVLPYRSINFQFEHFPDRDLFQSVGTVNYPNEEAFTRITEFKHITGQKSNSTSIMKEFPVPEGDPYYPIPRKQNQKIYKKYRYDALSLKDVTFVGRLAEYQYYNMDQVIASALTKANSVLASLANKSNCLSLEN